MGTVRVAVELVGLWQRADLSLGAHEKAAVSVVLEAGIRLTMSGMGRIRPWRIWLQDLGLTRAIGLDALFSRPGARLPCSNRDIECLADLELSTAWTKRDVLKDRKEKPDVLIACWSYPMRQAHDDWCYRVSITFMGQGFRSDLLPCVRC